MCSSYRGELTIRSWEFKGEGKLDRMLLDDLPWTSRPPPPEGVAMLEVSCPLKLENPE